MDKKILFGIAGAAGVVVLVAAMFLVQGAPPASEFNGQWVGAYNSTKGTGEYRMVVAKTNTSYVGYLNMTGAYTVTNAAVHLAINNLNADIVSSGVHINFNISGIDLKGTWNFVNSTDSGAFYGAKIGGVSGNPFPELDL